MRPIYERYVSWSPRRVQNYFPESKTVSIEHGEKKTHTHRQQEKTHTHLKLIVLIYLFGGREAKTIISSKSNVKHNCRFTILRQDRFLKNTTKPYPDSEIQKHHRNLLFVLIMQQPYWSEWQKCSEQLTHFSVSLIPCIFAPDHLVEWRLQADLMQLTAENCCFTCVGSSAVSPLGPAQEKSID